MLLLPVSASLVHATPSLQMDAHAPKPDPMLLSQVSPTSTRPLPQLETMPEPDDVPEDEVMAPEEEAELEPVDCEAPVVVEMPEPVPLVEAADEVEADAVDSFVEEPVEDVLPVLAPLALETLADGAPSLAPVEPENPPTPDALAFCANPPAFEAVSIRVVVVDPPLAEALFEADSFVSWARPDRSGPAVNSPLPHSEVVISSTASWTIMRLIA